MARNRQTVEGSVSGFVPAIRNNVLARALTENKDVIITVAADNVDEKVMLFRHKSVARQRVKFKYVKTLIKERQ